MMTPDNSLNFDSSVNYRLRRLCGRERNGLNAFFSNEVAALLVVKVASCC